MPLSAVRGHARLAGLLSRAIARGTLPPTLLFTGPAGVGKWRMARAVAQALNCLTPLRAEGTDLPLDACGACRACDRITRDVHVDVSVLEPDDKASIKIDVVREMLERTAYRPFEGRRRVVLVREADALESSSQNALLKSLEEPPPATVFILTTAVPGALLPTVRSRAMRMAFGRLTAAEVAEVLTNAHGVEPQDAREAAALADGSVGQALALGSADLAVLRETALLVLAHGASGAGAQTRLQAAATVVTGPSKKERPREDIGLILRMMASMLRDVELMNAGGDPQALANPALADELGRVARAYAGDRAREAFVAVDRALHALERNAGVKVVAEWLSLQI